MEAASPNPRKRGRPPSALRTEGIFTRSRSELFVHRTRSGRGRPDRSSKLITKHLGSPSKEDPLALLHPRPSIKDLRARRVFSPTTTLGECSPLKSRKIKDDPDGHAMPGDAALGKSQPSTSRGPELGGTDHVLEEGAGLKLDGQNVSLICEEKGLEGSPDEIHGNRADPDADIEFVLSDLSGVLYDLSGLLEFDGGGEVSSWADNSSNEFLRTTRTLDFDLFHESSQHDDGSILVGHASSRPDCVLDSFSAVTEGFRHAKMDEKMPTASSLIVGSADQSHEIPADPTDNAKAFPQEVSKEVEFNGTNKGDCVDDECIRMTRLESDILYKSQLPDGGSILVGHASSDPDCALNSLPAVTEGFCHAKMDEKLPAIGCFVTPNAQNNEIAADPNDKATSISPDVSREVEFRGDDNGDCMDEECIQTTPPDGDILHKSPLSDGGSILVGHASSDPDCALNSLPAVTGGICHAQTNENIPAISSLVISNCQSNEIPAASNDKGTSIMLDASRAIEFNGADKGDFMDEDCIQTTPPDSDILHKSQLTDDRGISMVSESVNPDEVADDMLHATHPTDGKEGFCQAKMDGHMPPIKRRKGSAVLQGVLGSRSRLKLFQTPDSLSYRRLLPFLKDLAKDNESSLEIHSCLDNGPFNIAKSAEGRTQPLFDSLSNKTNSNSCKADLSSVKCCSDLMTPSMEKAKEMPNVVSHQPCAVECETLHSSLKPLTEVPRQRTHEDSSILCNDEAVIQMAPDEEMAPHLEKFKLESTYKLDCRQDCVISAHDEESPNTLPLCLSIKDDAEHGSSARERKMDRINDFRKDWLKERPLVVDTSSRDGGQDDDSIVQNHPEHLSSTSTTGYNQSHVKVACPLKEENVSAVNRREVELGKAMEERPSTLLLDTPAQDSGLGNQKTDNLPLQQWEGLGTIQNEKKASCKAESSSSSSQCSRLNCLEKPTTEIPIRNHPENVSGDWLEEILSISCSESVLQLDQIILDSSFLEPGCEALVSVHATEFPDNELSCSSITNEASHPTREDAGSDIQHSSCSCRESIEKREGLVKELAIDVKPLEILDAPQHSSHVHKLLPAERLVLPPPKGILKKRPQYCKGLCTCQNCASFHLHAEKANELLRKQKQEAEEVAVGLMRELSCLRSIMEKSFSPKTDSIDGHTVVQTDQVRRLYSKALIAEEMARNRLRKMTEGLSNHCTVTVFLAADQIRWHQPNPLHSIIGLDNIVATCRQALQRQRVRFADHVEEKHIPKSEKEDG
ncbi:hypothetical protein ACLOJK_008138 [Asimina triloba]